MLKGKNRIAFFGCKNITKSCMRMFNQHVSHIDYLVTISPKMGKLNKVSGYMDLTRFAKKNKIKYYVANSYSLKDNKDMNFITNLNIDVAFSIGWQRLIPARILDSVRIGILGMHGSSDNLPFGRGRSPMNWSLIFGRNKFYTNLFKYEDNIDGGGIIDTKCFDINEHDTIETLHFKNMISMVDLIKKNYDDILNNNYLVKKQDDERATYFPKRIPEDGYIDWNNFTTKHIYNLSRALTKPFPGIVSEINKEKIFIWRLCPFSNSFDYSKNKPGDIIEVFYNNKFVVKTKDSSIIIHKFDISSIELIRKGKSLKGIYYRDIYKQIEKRYPSFVRENQKEVTLEKIRNFYEG